MFGDYVCSSNLGQARSPLSTVYITRDGQVYTKPLTEDHAEIKDANVFRPETVTRSAS